MIRVLHIVNIMDRAGLETMLMNYYRSIDRSQVQFDFLTHRDTPGAYENEIKSLGGHVYRAPRLYPQNYLTYFSFMERFFREHTEYKIVHSHIDTMSAFPLFAAKRAGVPVRIGHSHSSKLDIDAKFPIKYMAKLFMPQEANVYCACGEKAGQFMFGKRDVKIVHNAIDIQKFSYNENIRNSMRKKLGISNRFVIGHVGRFCYIKNQVFLLKIMRYIKEQIPDAVLLLIGKGEDEAMLRQKVENWGLKENVQFLTDRSDVNELYQTMDAFVMPSLFEGLPVVGVEAQANGLPCLFSDKISREILLTRHAEMMCLDQVPQNWANRIMTLHRNEIEDNKIQLADKGYDAFIEAEMLMNWYMGLIRKN